TALHPLWSIDRNDWVRAGELEVGERLRTETGSVIIAAIEHLDGGRPVFNVEVPGAHTYLVSPLSIQSHNADSCGTFGTGRPPHVANVTLERNGQVIMSKTVTSGNMTAEEAALQFPRSTLATHTEARAVKVTLEPGDVMIIEGKYAPCPSCKGAMN